MSADPFGLLGPPWPIFGPPWRLASDIMPEIDQRVWVKGDKFITRAVWKKHYFGCEWRARTINWEIPAYCDFLGEVIEWLPEEETR